MGKWDENPPNRRYPARPPKKFAFPATTPPLKRIDYTGTASFAPILIGLPDVRLTTMADVLTTSRKDMLKRISVAGPGRKAS